jgi:isocitrate lyase
MPILSKLVSRPLTVQLAHRSLATSVLPAANTSLLNERQKVEAQQLQQEWSESSRWSGVTRTYTPEDVVALRTSLRIEHTLARNGAERLWRSLTKEEPYVPALGAMTGNQAVQQVKAGLKAIYLSGWQVAADANLSGDMYPDLSLYPANSVPNVVRNVNKALARADQIHRSEGKASPFDLFKLISLTLSLSRCR